jgi:hypothetical protein
MVKNKKLILFHPPIPLITKVSKRRKISNIDSSSLERTSLLKNIIISVIQLKKSKNILRRGSQ